MKTVTQTLADGVLEYDGRVIDVWPVPSVASHAVTSRFRALLAPDEAARPELPGSAPMNSGDRSLFGGVFYA